MLVVSPDRKHLRLAASHKPSCEASRRAECGKSACSVRRGGGWKPATVRLVRHSQRKRRAPDRPDLRAWRHSSTLPRVLSNEKLCQRCSWIHRTFQTEAFRGGKSFFLKEAQKREVVPIYFRPQSRDS